jgi:hypothetical protein
MMAQDFVHISDLLLLILTASLLLVEILIRLLFTRTVTDGLV